MSRYVAYDYMTGWMSPVFRQARPAAAAARRHNLGAAAQLHGTPCLCRGEVYEVADDGYLMQHGRLVIVGGRGVQIPQV